MGRKNEMYLKNFFETLLQDLDSKQIFLMKHSHTLFFSEKFFKKLELKDPTYSIYYHRYDAKSIRRAYEPFLDIIREMWKKDGSDRKKLEEMLDRAEVYSLQRSLFESYITEGVAKRGEPLLMGEVETESQIFVNTLVRLLVNVAREHPFVLILDEVNQAGTSAFVVMEKLLEIPDNHIKILNILDDMGDTMPFATLSVNQFERLCMDKELVVHYFLPEQMETFRAQEEISEKTPSEEQDLLKRITTMSETFEFEQVDYYLKELVERGEMEKKGLTREEQLSLLHIYGWVCLCTGEYSYALVLADMMDMYMQSRDARKLLYMQNDCLHLKILAHLLSGNDIQVRENLNQSKQIARRLGDRDVMMRTVLLENMSKYSAWKDLWISDKDTEVPPELLQFCEEKKMYNHLAHIYLYSFDSDYRKFQTVEGIEDRLQYVNKGIEIG